MIWPLLTSAAVIAGVGVAVVVARDSGARTVRPKPGLPLDGPGFLLDFDGGLQVDPAGNRYFGDGTGGGHVAYLRGGSAGEVKAVPHDRGLAGQFPGPCVPSPKNPCAEAMLELTGAGDLSPETRDFAFGADVLVATGEATKGADVVRKGHASGTGDTGQWRLQFEEVGRASCAVTGKGKTEIHVVMAPVALDDSTWHRVLCTRSSDRLTIQVDETTRVTIAIPADLIVESPESVMVGGARGDRFFGAVDNVFYRVAGP